MENKLGWIVLICILCILVVVLVWSVNPGIVGMITEVISSTTMSTTTTTSTTSIMTTTTPTTTTTTTQPIIKSAIITVDEIEYKWYDYSDLGISSTGTIYSVKFSVENTGDVPIKPIYQIDVIASYTGKLIETEKERPYSEILPGETEYEYVSLYAEVKSKTLYSIIIKLYDENTDELVTTEATRIDMGR